VLLHNFFYRVQKIRKSLSIRSVSPGKKTILITSADMYERAKAQKHARLVANRPHGSFTVEAAMTIPLFLFAVVIILGFFPVMKVQMQVTAGLSYTSRMLAISCQDTEEPQKLVYLAKGRILFQSYFKEQGFDGDRINGKLAGVSLLESDFSGDYITLRASYRIKLPISFWKIKNLPVKQCVRSRKWTGANPDEETGEDGYVYVTPRGSAYHKSTSCSYLDLSIQSVTTAQLQTLRNKDGAIYYPCSCYQSGATSVYITDYGTQYHSSLGCPGLKRSVYKISRDQIGSRHPCNKCYGGG
jgi:hypothetical protein